MDLDSNQNVSTLEVLLNFNVGKIWSHVSLQIGSAKILNTVCVVCHFHLPFSILSVFLNYENPTETLFTSCCHETYPSDPVTWSRGTTATGMWAVLRSHSLS